MECPWIHPAANRRCGIGAGRVEHIHDLRFQRGTSDRRGRGSVAGAVSVTGCSRSTQAPYRVANGSADRPCRMTLSSTVIARVEIAMRSESSTSRSSTASNANTTVARPRGPNQPMNATLLGRSPDPISDSATGTIRNTVGYNTANSSSRHPTWS